MFFTIVIVLLLLFYCSLFKDYRIPMDWTFYAGQNGLDIPHRSISPKQAKTRNRIRHQVCTRNNAVANRNEKPLSTQNGTMRN